MPSTIAVIFATALTVTSVNDSTPATVQPSPAIVKHEAERHARSQEIRRKIDARLDELERMK